MGKGNCAFGHEGGGHWNMEHLGESDERFRGAGTDHTVTGQDDRTLGLRDDACCLLDLKVGWGGGVRLLHFNGLLAHSFRPGDILRKIDEACAWFFGLCYLESLAHDLRNYFRLADLRGVLGDWLEHVDEIENLMTFFVHARGRALAGNGNHGRTVHVCIRYAGDEIGCPGAESRDADDGFAREASVDIGHECCTLLVAGRNELDRTGDERIHDIDVLLAGYTEH